MNSQPSNSARNAISLLLGLVLFVIGLILGRQYVTFSNAGPQHLISWQLDNYVHGLANTYTQTQDANFLLRALCYGQEAPDADLLAIQGQRDNGLIGSGFEASYDTVLGVVDQVACEGYRVSTGGAAGGAVTGGSGLIGNLLTILLVLGILGALAYFFMGRGGDSAEIDAEKLDEPAPYEEPTAPRVATPTPTIEQTPLSAPLSTPPPQTSFAPATVDEPTPLGGFQTAYVRGDDAFDKSFIIENGNGDFLGECGVSISESVGTEDGSRNVTAFEIWLFDKNDTHTVTKVVMSDHAFNDEATRAKLAPRGEPVMASYDNTVALETNSLIINADVSEIIYSTMSPSNGVFERFTVDLSAWVKSESEIRAAHAGDELDF